MIRTVIKITSFEIVVDGVFLVLSVELLDLDLIVDSLDVLIDLFRRHKFKQNSIRKKSRHRSPKGL